MRATNFRFLVFFLIFFQVAAIYYRVILPSPTSSTQVSEHPAVSDSSLEEPLVSIPLQDLLYSPEKLLLPDAWLSPIPTFQFGFIVIPACFLFILFSFFSGTKVKERPYFFANSYYHILFLSVILINAP
jgi:hypothetical protein